MFFASDNWAGVHPSVAANLSANATGFSAAYGDGELDRAVYQRFSELFEREVAVFFVATGTAANSLSLTAYNKTGGIAFCHREAHLIEDECGALEHFSGGARLCPVDGALGKIDPANLERAVGRFAEEFVHAGRPMAISITQSTEIGTIYRLDDIAAIAEIAKRHGLPLHMDGARFANALASLETSPAEMTWRRGVDIVSFGGTKNGCWCAEAVVLFDLDRAKELAFLRKRAAQLFSKSRFIAAQFEAYFRDGLWLDTARHANAMAARLAAAIEDSPAARLAWLPQANEVFAIMKKAEAERLQAAGAAFYDWHRPAGFEGHIGKDEALYRFVTSFATTEQHVDRFRSLLGDGVPIPR
jgi:threonine aldolase